jgi:hypothetical protein
MNKIAEMEFSGASLRNMQKYFPIEPLAKVYSGC